MMAVKTIKGIDEESWSAFKSLSAKNNMTMARFLEVILNNYINKSTNFWARLSEKEPTLTPREAEEMLNTITHLRKEKGFRQ